MDVLDKLTILTDAAKYDAACTSSGGNRGSKVGYVQHFVFRGRMLPFLFRRRAVRDTAEGPANQPLYL